MRKLFCFLCSGIFFFGAACNVSAKDGSSFETSVIESDSEEVASGKTYTIGLDVGAVANSEYFLSVASVTLKHGDAINLPEPSCAGYLFKYWSLKGREFTDNVFTSDKDIVLIAEWQEMPWPDNY